LRELRKNYPEILAAGLETTGFFEGLGRGATVFLKPNLTFPVYRPGVMTSFECVKAATELLISRGLRVIIGEADGGGYNRFSMDEVFQKIGLRDFAAKTGAELVNISFAAPEIVRVKVGRKEVDVPVPKMLLRDVDAFITMPVPKIHMNTLVSMSLKNQWGCIQNPSDRLKLHPYFPEVIHAIASQLPRPFSIIDGCYGLNRSGPLRGDPVELNWVLVSNDLVAADRVGCRLLQVDEERVQHLQFFKKRGWWTGFDEIELNQPFEPLRREKFYLKRDWTDFPGVACFHNACLAWLGYHSPLAGFLHWLLYRFRQPFYDYKAERSQVRPQ